MVPGLGVLRGRIIIPKVLEIDNPRLTILNITVVVLCIALLVFRIVAGRLYLSALRVSTVAQITLRPATLRAMVDFDVGNEPLCLKEWSNTGLSVQCDRVCPFDVFSPTCCVNPHELIEQNTYDSIYLVTHKAERCLTHVGTAKCGDFAAAPFQFDNKSSVCPGASAKLSFAENLQAIRASMQAGGGGTAPAIPEEDLRSSVCRVQSCEQHASCDEPARDNATMKGSATTKGNVTTKGDVGGASDETTCSHRAWLPLDQPVTADGNLSASGFAHSIFPSIAELSLKLTYTYATERIPPQLAWRPGRQRSGTMRNVLGVLLDREDGVHRTLLPGEDVELSVPELIAVAHGLPPEAVARLPRISSGIWLKGGEVTVHVDCFSDLSNVHSVKLQRALREVEAIDDVGVSQPLCLVNVSWANVDGTDELPVTRIDRREDEAMARLSRKTGLRILAVRGGGLMNFFDSDVLMMEVSSAIVIATIPVWLVRLFALYGLGHLSKIYRRVVFDNYRVQEECGGMVCRLAMQSLAFHELARGTNDVSVVVLCAHLQAVMRHHSLDLAEISHLTSFCFQQISAGHDLDIDAFCTACSASDRMCLEHARRLFDADRKTGFAERFFTPSELWQEQQGVLKSRARGTFHLWVDRLKSGDPEPEIPTEERRVKFSVPSSWEDLTEARSVRPRSFGSSLDGSSVPGRVSSTFSATTARLEVELQQLTRRCAEHEGRIAELQGSLSELQEQLSAQAETCRAEFGRFGQELLRRGEDSASEAKRAPEAQRDEQMQELLAAAEARAKALGAHVEEGCPQPQDELHTSLGRLLRLESEVWVLLEVQKESQQREDAACRSRLEPLEAEIERLGVEVETMKALCSQKPPLQPESVSGSSCTLPLPLPPRFWDPTSTGASRGSLRADSSPGGAPSIHEPVARRGRRSPWREKMLAKPSIS